MKHSQIHAMILGTSFVVSLVIVLARISFAGKPSSSAGTTEVVAPLPEEEPVEDAVDAYGEAERLVAMADELYRGSAAKDGREGELIQAQEMLKNAQALLEPIIETEPRARELNRRLGQLIQDVNRAAGF